MNERIIEGKSFAQHVKAARAAGLSLVRYAREHGLSADSLYSANRRLSKKAASVLMEDKALMNDAIKPAKATVAIAPAFVPLEIATTTVSMKARLPNGIELEFSGVDSLSWPAVAQTLASLPCLR